MIQILAINPTGFFSYGLMPTINLQNQGTVFLQGINEDFGGSNGAGKSSLLNTLKEILFGKNDSGKSGANAINKHHDWCGGSFGVVWLRDHDNRFWRVIAVRKWKEPQPDFIVNNGPSEVLASGNVYAGQDMYVEWWNGEIWIDARPTPTKENKSMEDVRVFVPNNILHMTYEQFSAYVCLGQKAESALVNGTSGAREEIIQAVTDVSIWTRAADIIKNTYTTQLQAQTILEREIAGMKSALNSISIPNPEEINSARAMVENAKNAAAQIDKEIAGVQATIAFTEQSRSLLRVEGIQQEFDILDAEETHIRGQYDQAIDIEPDLALLDKQDAMAAARHEHSAVIAKFKKYTECGEGDCKECGQQITGEYLEKQKSELHYVGAGLSHKLDTLHHEIQALETQYASKLEQVEQAARNLRDQSLLSLNNSRNVLRQRQSQYTNLTTTMSGYKQKLQTLGQQKVAQPGYIISAENHLRSLEQRTDERQSVEHRIKELEQRFAAGDSEIEHLRWTERNLKKVRVHEYESAITRLNQLIAERIQEMFGAGLHARFVTAQQTVKGDNIKTGLEFLVDTPCKEGVPIELYSGGETKIIVVAVFLAMIELALERGSGVNLAAIDEIDEHLDDFRADKLVDAIDAIRKRVSTCLIISHKSRLLNTMSFDQTWIIRKKNEFATIETGAA